LQIDTSSSPNPKNRDSPYSARTSTDILNHPPSSVSHHRSNTVPSRHRKISNQQTTHLPPTCKQNENIQQEPPSQPFSPSLLPSQPRRRIRIIDDTDEGESISSSVIVRDD
jgi:hypothetical protein